MAVAAEYDGLAKAILQRAGMALAQTAGTQISPAVSQYRDWTFGVPGGNGALPRGAADFLLGAFGPQTPNEPAGIDYPSPGDERPEPRRFEYPVGWNLAGGKPGSEGLKLAAFVQLRAFADMYSLVRAAIEVRKQEILGIEWELIPTRDAARTMKTDENAHSDWLERKTEVENFWKRPDPDYPNYQSWMSAFLEDLFVVDAPCLYLHPSRMKGRGVCGSDIASLDLIDGTTIRPMLDIRGGRPKPPNVAYQQFIWGVPRTDLMQVILGHDISDLEFGEPIDSYRGDQLLYLPYIRRSWTPYGFPGIERALMPVVTGLKKQQFALEFFTEGSIPGMFVVPGPGIDTPEQMRKLQDTLNFLAGDQSWKHKIIVLPHGSTSEQHKKVEVASQYDDAIAAEVCMAYEVHPDEIGLQMGSKSKGIQFGGSATASDSQDQARQRKATKPLLRWLAASVFNFVTQEVLGQADMQWSWIGWQDEDDQSAVAIRLLADVKSGALTLDEYRKEFGRDPYGFPATSEPLIISERGIVVPLQHLDTSAIADQINDPAGLAAQIHNASTPDDAGAKGQNTGATPAGAKAALDELEKLRRFMKKGRPAADWKPEHLPEPMHARIIAGELEIAEAKRILKAGGTVVDIENTPAERALELIGDALVKLADRPAPSAPDVTVKFEDGAFRVNADTTIEQGALTVEPPPPAHVTIEKGAVQIDQAAPLPAQVTIEKGAVQVEVDATTTVEAPKRGAVRVEKAENGDVRLVPETSPTETKE